MLKRLSVYFFCFTAPLCVCSIVFPSAEAITLFLSFFLMFITYKRELLRDFYQKQVLYLFFFPMLITAGVACIQLFIKNDGYYTNYFQTILPVRLVHILVNLFIFVCIYSYIQRNIEQYKNVFRAYYWGIVIILGIFGFWQILSNLFGIWCPEIETRSHLYFARDAGLSRITSIASEPSYLVPFIIDAIFLILILNEKKFLIVFLLVILFFSFSFGAYMEIFILSIFYFLLSSKREKLKFFLLFMPIIGCVILLFPDWINIAIEIISSRQELQSGFDPHDNGRTSMILYPIESLFQDNLFTLVFGNGLASFKYLNISDSNCLFVTSNNIYADLMYEGGVFSLICLLFLFSRVWIHFNMNVHVLNTKTSLYIKLFLIHIALSSFYRADYATERYIVLLLIVGAFYIVIKNKYDICNYT